MRASRHRPHRRRELAPPGAGFREPVTPARREYLPFGRPDFTEAEIAAVSRVLRSGWIGMGAETLAFEAELQRWLSASHVVTVSSCTSALFLSLLVAGVEAGDEVVCPSLTWCATANAALYLGAKPIFCDVDPETLCAGPEQIARALTSRTRAVIVVHFGGLAADVEGIRGVLPDSVALVEDAAHALGARFPDATRVGASGNPTCFSFYANKNLSTGEGGAIALRDGDDAARLRSLRQNGMHADAWQRFTNRRVLSGGQIAELGYKMNYTDLQASIGRVQLARQDELASRRLLVAERYAEGLGPLSSVLRFQRGVLDARHSRHLFVVVLGGRESRRDEMLVELRARSVGASIHYPPLHEMPLYRGAGRSELGVTDDVCRRLLTLPISASMSAEDAEYVVDAVTELMS